MLLISINKTKQSPASVDIFKAHSGILDNQTNYQSIYKSMMIFCWRKHMISLVNICTLAISQFSVSKY